MIPCRFTSFKTCESEYAHCESCRVPNSFGVFFVLKGTKMVQEQRFILEWQRKARIQALEMTISNAELEIEKLRAMPSADEYRRNE